MKLTISMTPEEFMSEGLAGVASRFDAEHEQAEKAFVSPQRGSGNTDSSAAQIQATRIFSDGAWCDGFIYDRSKLQPNNRITGPAIVTEMDSTSVILPDHVGIVDPVGNIVIWPADHANAR